MDQERKAKWIEALRSGKYKQHRNSLFDWADGGEGLCCLGVGVTVTCGVDVKKAGMITNPAAECLGLTALQRDTLTVMNDGNEHGPSCSFSEIADYIEANL